MQSHLTQSLITQSLITQGLITRLLRRDPAASSDPTPGGRRGLSARDRRVLPHHDLLQASMHLYR